MLPETKFSNMNEIFFNEKKRLYDLRSIRHVCRILSRQFYLVLINTLFSRLPELSNNHPYFGIFFFLSSAAQKKERFIINFFFFLRN